MKFTLGTLAIAAAGLSPVAFAQAQPPQADAALQTVQPAETATRETVVVTGTRAEARTQFEALSPVDVVTEKALKDSTSEELSDTLAQLIPTFNVQRLPLADGLVFVRPATLRNLSPDQTLVLINGKRLHRSALLGSRGSQAPDFALIPTQGIKRIEVLRDGASAQYGSDAIAGVVNVILNDEIGTEGYTQYSEYYEGDGENLQIGGRIGMDLGGGAVVALSAETASSEPTSRTRQRPDAIALQAARPDLNIPNPVQRWGQPELDVSKFSINAAIPAGDGREVYGFGTLAFSEGLTDFNWRNPVATGSAFNTTRVYPGFNLLNTYPTGFTPRFGSEAVDLQTAAGLRGESGAFRWDFSGAFGLNQLQFNLSESINASLGPDSPTSFYLGQLEQRETNLNADFAYSLALGGLSEPVNIAFGAERREETYSISAGEPASYAVGPGAAAGLAPLANGFPGFSNTQAGTWSQESYAAYVDVEATLAERLTLGGALRYEDFSEFGETTNGKASLRYEFRPGFAFRASWSTGFRAPTPGQLNTVATTQGLDTVTLQLFTRGRLSPTDPLAVSLGARPLTPEESETVSGGFALRAGGFSATLDAYEIEVTDRFSESAARPVPAGVANPQRFTSVSFFANDFDTKTRGVDLVLDYSAAVGPGELGLTAAYGYNETEVTGGATGVASNVTQRTVFEEGRPQHNATGSATYAFGPWEIQTRARYYGEWTDSSGNATGDIFQTFGAITLFDVALTYAFNENFAVRVGAENVGDEYPDEATFQASRGLIYSRNAPYDTDGGKYYVRLTASF